MTPREFLFSWKKKKKKPGHPMVSANRVDPPTSVNSAEWMLETGSCSLPYNCSWVLFELHSSLKMKKKKITKKEKGWVSSFRLYLINGQIWAQ